jgi:integrase
MCALSWRIRPTSTQAVFTYFHGDFPGDPLKLLAQPLPPVLLRALRQHAERQYRERAELGDEWHDSDLVFVSERGTPLEPRNVVRHFKAALKNAGLPETIRFHDLRHSCATLMIAQGVHPRVIMEILGHSQISTTMKTYAHVLPATQCEATTKIDALFPERATPNVDDGTENPQASVR